MKKFAIFVHASENEGAKALHALLYAQELHEAGHDVKVIFDGAGTVWIKKFEDEQNDFNPLYKAVKKLGVIAGACEYCAGAFGVESEVRQSGIQTLGESKGHPSLAELVANDYQIIIL
ncbi:DsrE family protein [Aneurinibacillus sp. Ricciae_BoGa-3]|uniref:DsrE family protein n=1 Tax=Aneurinibacillus sp. Ricciae_BoGa-3 TaxID=3022697 RepID=UPI002342370F|nr:DsrE family protein [Aneurinibacillus sp. Ricciae_BoGa-3]WCK52964.1 DsrE family protein [Aneurinibacillus sp. Ricciae_BoGa-3]